MTTPAEALRAILTQHANRALRDRGVYENRVAPTGSSSYAGQRVLSDFGFLTAAGFDYFVPSASHVTAHAEPRPVVRLVVYPYGLRDDLARLTSTAAAARQVSSSATTGVRRFEAAQQDFLVSGELDDDTVAQAKTAALLQRMLDPRRGPAVHAVVTRSGGVIVCAPVDHETASAGQTPPSIDVALEGALAISRDHHEQRDFAETLQELPYTVAQMLSLGTLVKKLQTAFPNLVLQSTTTTEPGVFVAWPDAVNRAGSRVVAHNLLPRVENNGSPFDFTGADLLGLVDAVDDAGDFDLATEVFVPPPRLVATRNGPTRAAMAAHIPQLGTLGANATALIAYAPVAGAARTEDMAAAPRHTFYAERSLVAQRESEGASGAAAAVAAATPYTPVPAVGVDPHVFDFTAGFWGDGQLY